MQGLFPCLIFALLHLQTYSPRLKLAQYGSLSFKNHGEKIAQFEISTLTTGLGVGGISWYKVT